MMHDFREQLEFSIKEGAALDWDSFYRAVWPDVVETTEFSGPCWHQKRGVDRIVYRFGGQSVTIDEKIRRKDYGDFLAEIWSVAHVRDGQIVGKTAGWTVCNAKITDYIAYAIPERGRVWLLPFDLLRRAVQRRWLGWSRDSRCRYPVQATNRGYVTISIAVPWALLLAALHQEMRRDTTGHIDRTDDPQLPLFGGLA